MKNYAQDLAQALNLDMDRLATALDTSALQSKMVRVTQAPMYFTKTPVLGEREMDFADTSLSIEGNDRSKTLLLTPNQISNGEYWLVKMMSLEITSNTDTPITSAVLAELQGYINRTVLTVSQNSDDKQFEIPLSRIIRNSLNLAPADTSGTSIITDVAKGEYHFPQTPLEFGGKEAFSLVAKTYGDAPTAEIAGFDFRLTFDERLYIRNTK